MSGTKGRREAASGSAWREPNAPSKTKKPKKESGKWGGGKTAAVILLCILAVAATAAGGWWFTSVKPPDTSTGGPPPVSDNNNPGKGDTELDQTGNTGGTGDTGQSGETEPTGRKEDYYTFLLIGKDTAGGGNTDTLILVSYDVPNGQVNMMSIPRDTVVNVTWSVKKINSIYMASEKSGGGLENLKKHVAQLTGITVDRTAIIEWKAVGELVEAVGGVEFDVPRNMNYDDPYQDLHIHLNKGMQTLSGKQAMAMLRYRKDNPLPDGTVYEYGDDGRTATQQAFLKAMAKKVLKLENITKVGEFLKIFMDNVKTDMTLGELTWFATKAFGSVDADSIRTWTMPYEDIGTWRGGYYFMAVPDKIAELIDENFNPYNRHITVKDLQIVQRNEDGSCYVTNGTLADDRWAGPYNGSHHSEFGGGETNTGPGTGIVAAPNTWTGEEETTPPSEEESGSGEEPPDWLTGSENPGGEESPGGGENPDDPGNPGGTGNPGVGEEPGGTENPNGQENPGGTENPGGEDNPGGTEDPGGQEDPGSTENPGETGSGETEGPPDWLT